MADELSVRHSGVREWNAVYGRPATSAIGQKDEVCVIPSARFDL
jgi:hypothetical protein